MTAYALKDMVADSLGPDGSYRSRLLGPQDLAALQGLFERCADYFQVATGGPPAKDEASRAFVAGPPAKNVDDKRTVGIFGGDDALIGTIDGVVDWPKSGVWTVGMVLLDPAHRGRGLGRSVLEAFEAWARHGRLSRGGGGAARSIRTAVVAHHDAGRRFLERMGYAREETVDGYDAGRRTASIVYYTKAWAP